MSSTIIIASAILAANVAALIFPRLNKPTAPPLWFWLAVATLLTLRELGVI